MQTKVDAKAQWRTVMFDEVVHILDSRRVPVNSTERAKRSGDVPYYGATGQVGFIDTHLFNEELVLLGEDGAPFLDPAKPKAYLIRGKSWVNNHAHVLRGKPGMLNTFLLYQLNSIDYRPYVSGTTRLKLPQGPMKQIRLLVPKEEEQKRIVAEIEKQFTRLEAGVSALKRVQANLKRYRAAVLKAACEGKLVPTEAELAKKEKRSYETGEELLNRILVKRRRNWSGRGKYKEPTASDVMKLDPLLDGWAWSTFEQISERVTVGYVGSMKQEYLKSGIPFLRGQNVRENRFDSEGMLFISHEFHKKLSKSALQPGDLAVVRSGAVGVTCVIPDSLPVANCSDLVLIQRPLGFVSRYGAYYMNSLAKRHVVAGKVGVALIHFNTKSVAALNVPLPPFAEQERIVAEVERRLSVIEELETVVKLNLDRATRLRQSILQKAFSGGL